ncbi:unnamed protein product [Sphenostylis stenocarpa]|uniref:Uncharacterized protein n=1 Tax=Sphenostylis stenocarpa TaxID=92480 RepID=A0AA86S1E4_9FABA|nr:unnamed protein product [Sphenostylis stenocarpa]
MDTDVDGPFSTVANHVTIPTLFLSTLSSPPLTVDKEIETTLLEIRFGLIPSKARFAWHMLHETGVHCN